MLPDGCSEPSYSLSWLRLSAAWPKLARVKTDRAIIASSRQASDKGANGRGGVNLQKISRSICDKSQKGYLVQSSGSSRLSSDGLGAGAPLDGLSAGFRQEGLVPPRKLGRIQLRLIATCETASGLMSSWRRPRYEQRKLARYPGKGESPIP